MLKKITVISLIVMVVMLLATAVLAPFAISQVAEKVGTVVDAYSTQEERLVIPAEGVKTVSFDHGHYISAVTLLPSPDGDIHVYSDGYAVRDSQFSYSIEKEHGHLEIGRCHRSDLNGLSAITPENLMVSLSGLFYPNGVSVQLYLPKGIAYDLDSWMVGINHWNEAEVETYYAEETGEYNDGTSYKDGTMFIQPEPDISQQPVADVPLTQEEQTALRERLDLAGMNLDGAYQLYLELGDTERLWNDIGTAIDEAHILYQELLISNGLSADEMVNLAPNIYEVLQLYAEQNQVECDRLRLQRQYRDGLVEKEDFYMQDLELDHREEELDNTLDTPEYDRIEDMIDELEERLGLHTLFAEELDLD